MPPNIPGSFKARAALRAWCLLALVLWASRALCALPCTTEAASSLSKPPNNLGLVGYWSFNEGTSTVATDFSGNRNTGTLNNFANPPTPTSGWRNGKLGKALQFDGNTTYVEVPDAANLNFTSSQSFTVAAWVYLPALPLTWKGIVTKGRDFDDWYGLWVSDTGRWYLASDEADDPNSPASTGWHYVVGTQAGGSIRTLYIDGIATDTGAVANGAITGSLFIGGAGGQSENFDGIIDEVRVYNRALSASEVAALAKSGAVKFTSNSKTLTQGSSLENGLVGLWTFDGADVRWTSATAGVAYDRSGNNNTGTLTNMSQSDSPALGKLGQAFNFDGTDDRIPVGVSIFLARCPSQHGYIPQRYR